MGGHIGFLISNILRASPVYLRKSSAFPSSAKYNCGYAAASKRRHSRNEFRAATAKQSLAANRAAKPQKDLPPLDVVVHRKLQRMRPQPEGRDLMLAFVSYPAFNELRSKNVTFKKEVVIGLKSF